MARINSYTGEVVSEVTEIEKRDDDFVIHGEDAVLEAIGLEPNQSVVLKGTIGDESLTVEPAPES